MGEDVTAAQLGGHKVHEKNGVAHFVAPSDADAALLARDLLGYLPSHRDLELPIWEPRPAGSHDPSEHVPDNPRQVYDVRSVISGIADGGDLLEVAPDWARNLVTAFIRDRRPAGRGDRQPAALSRAACSTPPAPRRARASSTSATTSACRCSCWSTPPASCPARPGEGGCDPARRHLRQRLRQGDGAAHHGDPAQGLRRRLHHDELQGPRRRLRLRLAAG